MVNEAFFKAAGVLFDSPAGSYVGDVAEYVLNHTDENVVGFVFNGAVVRVNRKEDDVKSLLRKYDELMGIKR